MDVKYQMGEYLLFDYAGLERHLEEMSEKGWMLEKPSTIWWKFRKVEPRRRKFAIAYIPDASEFNADLTESQKKQMAAAREAGWEKVADWFQMQIYVTEQPNPVPMETDEVHRLEMIRRAMKKNFLPSAILLLVMSIMLMFMQGGALTGGLAFSETNRVHLYAFLMALLLFVTSIVYLISYGNWYRKSKVRVARGGTCAGVRFYRYFGRVTIALVVLLLVMLFASLSFYGQNYLAIFMVFYLAAIMLLVFLLRKVQQGLKRFGFPRVVNILLTLLADVVLAGILIGVMMWMLFTFWLR